MADKKASIVAEKKASIKKSSAARASIAAAAAALEGDAASALGLTPEVWFDPKKEEALAAKEAQERLEIRALPVRQYLEASVVPLLLHGLQLLAIERYGYQTSFYQSTSHLCQACQVFSQFNTLYSLMHVFSQSNCYGFARCTLIMWKIV